MKHDSLLTMAMLSLFACDFASHTDGTLEHIAHSPSIAYSIFPLVIALELLAIGIHLKKIIQQRKQPNTTHEAYESVVHIIKALIIITTIALGIASKVSLALILPSTLIPLLFFSTALICFLFYAARSIYLYHHRNDHGSHKTLQPTLIKMLLTGALGLCFFMVNVLPLLTAIPHIAITVFAVVGLAVCISVIGRLIIQHIRQARPSKPNCPTQDESCLPEKKSYHTTPTSNPDLHHQSKACYNGKTLSQQHQLKRSNSCHNPSITTLANYHGISLFRHSTHHCEPQDTPTPMGMNHPRQ